MYIRVGLRDWPFHSSIEPQPLLFHCFLQSLYVRERTSQVSELLLKTAEKCAQGMKVLSPHNPHQYPSDRLRSQLLGQRQSVPFSLSRNMHQLQTIPFSVQLLKVDWQQWGASLMLTSDFHYHYIQTLHILFLSLALPSKLLRHCPFWFVLF